ncbi:TetR/AcrR family transcriptional regulator [Kitasatospora sp. NPDC088346]|uniref:TetR/AcrR family transcriptional regulator n=1 Tax=Kitasatospora sp. NPDC088346 TaxID=3364073 RepID=UPI0038087930
MDSGGSLRERLVDVGVELVTAEGPGSLGLREIARRAGVSHGAPRRYFPTHHALLSTIARRGFADLSALFAAATGGAASPRGQLHALGRAYVGYALAHRGMFELMFRHDLLDGGKHRSDQPRLRDSTLPLFERTVGLVAEYRAERAVARRPFTPSDTGPPPAVTAAALWANLHGTAQLWAWGSLQLALDTPPADHAPAGRTSAGRTSAGRTSTGRAPAGRAPADQGPDALDHLLTAVLDAHLGPSGA